MDGLGLALWAFGGAVLSAVHWLLLAAFVASLDVAAEPHKIRRHVRRSYLVRYGTLMLLLVLAIQQSVPAGLAAAAGFGIVRIAVALWSGCRAAVSPTGGSARGDSLDAE